MQRRLLLLFLVLFFAVCAQAASLHPGAGPVGEKECRLKYIKRSNSGVTFGIDDGALSLEARAAVAQLPHCELTTSAIHNYWMAPQGTPLTGIVDLKHHKIHLYPLVLQLEQSCLFTFTLTGTKKARVEGKWTSNPIPAGDLPPPFTTPAVPCSVIQTRFGQAMSREEAEAAIKDEGLRAHIMDSITYRGPAPSSGVTFELDVTVAKADGPLAMNEYAQRQIPPALWKKPPAAMDWDSLRDVGFSDPTLINSLRLTETCNPNCLITHEQQATMKPKPGVRYCERNVAGHHALGTLLRDCRVETGASDATHAEMIGFTITAHISGNWVKKKQEPAGWPFIYFSGTSRTWNKKFAPSDGSIPYQVADLIYQKIITALADAQSSTRGSCSMFAAERYADQIGDYSLNKAQPARV